MCPGNWKDGGKRCPESNQPPIMPDFWYSTAKEIVNPLNEMEITAEYTTDLTKPFGDPSRYMWVPPSNNYFEFNTS